jgi:DNA polymerase elongation subunit (family B)
MNIYFDIETIPQQPEEGAKFLIAQTIEAPSTMSVQATIDAWHNGEGKYAGAKQQAIEKAYRATSFDASKGQICSIAWAVGDGVMNVCGAYGEASESDLLRLFFDSVLIDLEKNPAYFIGHYISGFDLKFVWQRAVILGVKPPFNLPFRGRHGSDYFDTMNEWAGYKDRISMDNLAKALGIEGKGDMDGSMVWDAWKGGEYAKVCEYNADDVRIVREIHKRLTFA